MNNLDSKPFFSYSITDAERAKAFYENVLGLTSRIIPMCPGTNILELTLAGDMRVMLYEKKDHVPATFTVLNFEVPDIERYVTELSEEGVKFEHYDESDELGIMRNDGPLISWFRDPDGNFISIIQEQRMEKYSGDFLGEAPPSPS